MPDLILASTSRWRRQLLTDVGLNVQTEAPGVDERAFDAPGPVELASLLARKKAEAVAARHSGAVVLGADQVVWDGLEVFGKPVDPQDHFDRLCAMRGRSHELVTAVCMLGPDLDEAFVERTRMFVRGDLSDEEIRRYVQMGEGSGCAGGYAVEAHGLFLFEKVEGDWHNVIGLPLMRVLDVLRRRGWRYGVPHA
ncbi:MAG: septum formation protein Maf [Proteobacteria bacterium]|nr:septum formation protein Maf [Pseudomonadota bacterium]